MAEKKLLCKMHKIELLFLSKTAKGYLCNECIKAGYYNIQITEEWESNETCES